MKPLWLILLTVLLASCGGDSQTDRAVPRRYAYPRASLYSPEYVSMEGSPALKLNRSTTVTADSTLANGTRWLTAFYPRYNGSLYATVRHTSPAELPSVISNRMERISLNAGSGSVENISFESAGGLFHCELFMSRSESVSPVQFLAYNRAGDTVAYGTFNFSPDVDVTRTDSLAPVVNAVREDITELLKHLDDK